MESNLGKIRFNFKGLFDPLETYSFLDGVYHNEYLYMFIGSEPSSNTDILDELIWFRLFLDITNDIVEHIEDNSSHPIYSSGDSILLGYSGSDTLPLVLANGIYPEVEFSKSSIYSGSEGIYVWRYEVYNVENDIETLINTYYEDKPQTLNITGTNETKHLRVYGITHIKQKMLLKNHDIKFIDISTSISPPSIKRNSILTFGSKGYRYYFNQYIKYDNDLYAVNGLLIDVYELDGTTLKFSISNPSWNNGTLSAYTSYINISASYNLVVNSDYIMKMKFKYRDTSGQTKYSEYSIDYISKYIG